MRLCRVLGTMTSTVKHEVFVGLKLLVVQPIDEAGKASGRIAVCYQGGGSFKDSWAAGTFENVPIRYMGKPYWMKEAEKKEEKKEEKK